MNRFLSPLAIALLGFAAIAPARAQFVYTTLDDPLADTAAGYGTEAQGINNQGEVVGTYFTGDNTAHGFLYQSGTYTTVNDPNAGTGNFNGTSLSGISNSGVIVGSYYDSSGVSHAFFDQSGTFTSFQAGTDNTFFNNINGNNVYGAYNDSSGVAHSFIYNLTTDSATYLTDDPNAGTAAGEGTFVQSSNGSEIIGNYIDSSRVEHPFSYVSGTYTTIGPANNYDDGINASGEISGNYDAATTQGLVVNGGVSTLFNVPGATDTVGIFNNDSGQIAGFYDVDIDGDYFYHGFIASPATTPEPGPVALLGSLTLTGAALLRRRRARRC